MQRLGRVHQDTANEERASSIGCGKRCLEDFVLNKLEQLEGEVFKYIPGDLKARASGADTSTGQGGIRNRKGASARRRNYVLNF